MNNQYSSGFTKSQWTGIAALLCLFIALYMYLGYKYNHSKETIAFEDVAGKVIHDVGIQLSEGKTILTALYGMHYASTELGFADISSFGSQLLEQSPHVTSFGRFGYVVDEDRDAFEDLMSERGLYNYSITQPEIDGSIVRRNEVTKYFPLTIIEPMPPAVARFLGLDVGVDEDMRQLLSESIVSNSSFVTTTPDHWPLGKSILIVNPTYLGNLPPTSQKARTEQLDGGYWLSINPDRLIAGAAIDLEDARLTLSVSNISGVTQVLDQDLGGASRSYFKFLYPTDSVTHHWPVGSSWITVDVTGQLGFSVASIWVGVLFGLALVGLYGLFVAFLHHQKIAAYARHQSLNALYEEREKAETTLNSIVDSVLTLDRDGLILHLNLAGRNLLGLGSDVEPVQKIDGVKIDSVLDCKSSKGAQEKVDLMQIIHGLLPGEKRDIDVLLAPDYSTDTIRKLTLSRNQVSSAESTEYIIVVRDVSTERNLTRQLEYQVNHDPMTGCTNRFYFEKRLGELLEDLKSSRRQHALCYLDLDQFKIVNDTCGHIAGDKLLKELTGNLKTLIRKGDVLSRLGGDEFGLILTDVSRKEIEQVGDKIFRFFQNYLFHYDGKAFPVRASIGMVAIDEESGAISDIMSAADIACYTAKDSGRNSLSIFSEDDESMSKRQEDMNWLSKLQIALREDLFRLYAQPVASIDGSRQIGAIQHYEFLLRLRDSAGNDIAPVRFIQAAERYDLMRDIDRWVIHNTLQSVAGFNLAGREDVSFSMNLSGQSAADPELLPYIADQFARHDVDASKIWFEITETAAITHFSIAVELINGIKKLGAKVVLDDFGSGLSSFGYLKNLPVELIKIDGQFVREIAINPIDREMVRAINDIGKAMGIETVAEFVESQEILDELIEIGVNYAQGYHIGEPCDINSIVEFQHSAKVA